MLQHLYSVRSCGTACFDCLSIVRGRGCTGTEHIMAELCEERSALRGHLQVRRGYEPRAHNAPDWLHLNAPGYTHHDSLEVPPKDQINVSH